MDWNRYGTDRWRVAVRLVAGAVALAVTVVAFRGSLVALAPLLWPPGGTRWFTLAAVVALSFLVPLLVVAGLADALYVRLRG